MAQSGYTPIQTYYSTTATNVPTSADLINGELSINITDGKLYYKDNTGVVQLLASKASAAGVTSFSAGTTGLTPNTVTSGDIVLSGTLNVTNGGTGLTNLTAGSLTYGTGVSAFATLAIGTAGQVLTVNSGGTAPQWSTLSSTAVTTLSFGTTGLTPATATSGAITVAGTLATTNGGTGLTSFTANSLVFANSTNSLTTGSTLTWNGTTLSITGALTASADSSFNSTGALKISSGTTAQQPGSPVEGMLRYNTTTKQFEGYSEVSAVPGWYSVGGSAISNDTTTNSARYPLFAAATTGTAQTIYTSNAKYVYNPSTGELQAPELIANNGIVVTTTNITANYTIAAGNNGMSIGPVTTAAGVTVTVTSGQRWVIL
jgi:hypothetical protein